MVWFTVYQCIFSVDIMQIFLPLCCHGSAIHIQSNLSIKGTEGNLKMCLYEQLSFIYRLDLSIKDTEENLKMCLLWAVVLYIQVKIIGTIHYIDNETALYRQWFVIYRYPFSQVWLYIYFFLNGIKKMYLKLSKNLKVKKICFMLLSYCHGDRGLQWWAFCNSKWVWDQHTKPADEQYT